MKRNYLPFAAGMATMTLLAGLLGATLAANSDAEEARRITTVEHKAGAMTGALNSVYAGKAGVALFGREESAPGATRTTAQGTEVPTVLTYVDDAGCASYYVSAETMAQLLDVAYGVTWNEELQCVDFGSQILTDGETTLRFTAEKNFDQSEITVAGTTTISGVGNSRSVTTVNGVTVVSDNSVPAYQPIAGEPKEEAARRQARIETRRATATAAEYGVTRGIFTETDPAKLDPAGFLGWFLDGDTCASDSGTVEQTVDFLPMEGGYASVTVKNAGEEDILVYLARPYTVGEDDSTDNRFSTVCIPAGKSLQRTFRMTEIGSAYLQNTLTVHAETVDGSAVSIRLTSEQYGPDAQGK